MFDGLWWYDVIGSSTSTSREAGSFVRPISPKSPVPSASAFENMGESDDDIPELDASYFQTNGYLVSVSYSTDAYFQFFVDWVVSE